MVSACAPDAENEKPVAATTPEPVAESKPEPEAIPEETPESASLASAVAPGEFDLINVIDPDLQAGLEHTIGTLGLGAPAHNGTLAVALVDLNSGGTPRLAMVNGHDMFYAASLPKIAILLGSAVMLDDGGLVMNDELDQDLNDMIRHSCNSCATRVLKQVGHERLLTILQSPEYHFYDPDTGGGLWVGKEYGPGTAYRRDPLAGTSHGATVFQAARFYYLLYHHRLVSPQQSQMMLETLVDPAIRHKFVRGLEEYKNLKLYRKSGSWKQYHSDSVLVVAENHAYILVALAEDPDGTYWLEKMAPEMHEFVTKGRVRS